MDKFDSMAEDLITALRSGGLTDEAILHLCADMDIEAMRSVALDEIETLVLTSILSGSPRVRTAVIHAAYEMLSDD
jgi:hypothetical protein